MRSADEVLYGNPQDSDLSAAVFGSICAEVCFCAYSAALRFQSDCIGFSGNLKEFPYSCCDEDGRIPVRIKEKDEISSFWYSVSITERYKGECIPDRMK